MFACCHAISLSLIKSNQTENKKPKKNGETKEKKNAEKLAKLEAVNY